MREVYVLTALVNEWAITVYVMNLWRKERSMQILCRRHLIWRYITVFENSLLHEILKFFTELSGNTMSFYNKR